MARPKTKQQTLDPKDITSSHFADELVASGKVRYRSNDRRYDYRRYGYDRTIKIQLGLVHNTIVGYFNATLSLSDAQDYLKWMADNCAWHRTTLSYHNPKNPVLTGDPSEVKLTSLPVPEVTTVYVSSTVHRKISPEIQADLDSVEAKKKERQAKEKQLAKERKAKADAKRRAAEKKAREQEASSEYNDLASALKTLKKHGLKIVTVEEKK